LNDYIIEISGLSKTYKDAFGTKKVEALKSVSLNIPRGVIFGLLGPNGAGKTTLIKILLGITRFSSGEIKLFDSSPHDYALRKRVGYLPENHKFPEYLTGYQMMKFYGELYNLSGDFLEREIERNLKLVKMLKWRNTKLKKYSKGMLQRIGLAQAMLHNPDLIILDEPTDGVDPIGRKEIRTILLELKNSGKTIFVNSHLLSEVEMISDSVAILNKGELIFNGSVDDLTTDGSQFEIHTDKEIDDNIKLKLTGFDFELAAPKKILLKTSDENNLNRFIDILRENNFNLQTVSPVKNNLEDKFISLIDRVENK